MPPMVEPVVVAAQEDNVFTPQAVMVALNRLDVGVHVVSVMQPRHGEIATVDQQVFLGDEIVRLVDDVGVHLVGIFIRSPVVLNDVAMAQVPVGRMKNHVFLSFSDIRCTAKRTA